MAASFGRLEFVEMAALALLVPLFWFPLRLPLLTLVALPVLPALWLVRWRLRGSYVAHAGVEAPLVFVLLAACVAAVPVTDWSLGLPKLLGMALGAWTLITLTRWVQTPWALELAVLGVAALALLLAAVGLLGAEWIPGKAPLLDPLYRRLPAAIRGVVPNTREGGIQPNELAATLVLVAPVLLAQALAPGRGWRGWAPFGAGLLASLVLLVTQSRSGIGGFGAAMLAGGGWLVWDHTRRAATSAAGLALRAAYAIVLVAAVVVATRLATGWVASAGAAAASPLDTFQGRLELWQRGVLMLQDFAFTGIGLGQFNVVYQALYVPVQVAPTDYVPHVHDVFLEYALELGVPGFVAFAALMLTAARGAWRAVGAADASVRYTALGLLLGLLGFGVFGLTDALAPGARAGLVLWVVLGLSAAMARVAGAVRCPDKPAAIKVVSAGTGG